MIIAITSPHSFVGETELCNRLFEYGLQTLHLRKPGATTEDCAHFIHHIKPEFHSRIVLHEHYFLAEEYGLKGIHLKSGTRPAMEETAIYGSVSISCHSFREIEQLSFRPDYLFLSPVFDSISKPGYRASFQETELKDFLRKSPHRIVALGGITAGNAAYCLTNGFSGIALLGYLWQQPQEALERFNSLKNTLKDFDLKTYATIPSGFLLNRHYLKTQPGDFPLQYITDRQSVRSIPEQVEDVCRGGVRWIQLRMKDASGKELIHTGKAVKKICRKYGACFLVNDRVDIALALDADGVHLGKEDMNPLEARVMLGDAKIIGATCNTLEDIRERAMQDVDYIGLGPYTFTHTKKNLSPVLGLQGYRNLLQKSREEGISIPIYAIGGIRQEDIPLLMQTGISGIALSSLFNQSPDPTGTGESILAGINRDRPDS